MERARRRRGRPARRRRLGRRHDHRRAAAGDADGPAVHLRREFELPAAPVSARLYASAHGVYELELNGRRVGDDVLAPGWTSYHHRLRYQTFDVTGHLTAGRNAVGAWLADGWFRGRLGFRGGRRAVYGEHTGLLAQLEIRCADGSTHVIAGDGTWRGAPGPIHTTGLYDGEHHDARREHDGWSSPGFDDAGWSPATVLAFDPGTLVAPDGPPVRRTELLRPVEVSTSPSGRTIVDFGQNLTGRLRIRVSGPAGTTVVLRHAEVLQDGELYVRPLRRRPPSTRTPCAAVGQRNGSRASPSTASATRRSPAGRGS